VENNKDWEENVIRFQNLFKGSLYFYRYLIRGYFGDKFTLDQTEGIKFKPEYRFIKNDGKRSLTNKGKELTQNWFRIHLEWITEVAYPCEHKTPWDLSNGRNQYLVIPPGNQDTEKCLFGAIDIDKYDDVDMLGFIIETIYKEQRFKNLVPCFTKSKGLHLYCFAEEPVPMNQMRAYLKTFLIPLSLSPKTEVFPKQDNLKWEKGFVGQLKVPGSAIGIPYGSCLERILLNGREKVNVSYNKVNAEWIKNSKLETGDLGEFLEYAESKKLSAKHFSNYPLLDLKESVEVTDKDVSNARPLSDKLKPILKNIKAKREHERGGTFDNHVVDFVYGSMQEKMSDSEIIEQLETTWEYSDREKNEKGIETYQGKEKADYFKTRINNCRTKFNKKDPGPLQDKFIKDVVYIKEIDKYWDNSTRGLSSERALEKTYGHIFKGTTEKFFKEHPDKQIAESIVYEPKLYNKETAHFQATDNKLWYCNKFYPSDLKPRRLVDRSDIAMFLALLEYGIPNEKYRNHFLDIMAFIVQNPGEKIRQATLIYTKYKQVFKGSIWRVMEMILGEMNAEPTNVKAMTDKGVMWTEKQLILIDECKSKGDWEEKENLINDLKTIITEKRIQQRKLWVDYKVVKHNTNFIIFTNNRDALSIEEDDERYFILFHEAERLGGKFYHKFHDWLEGPDKILKKGIGGGAELIYDFLLRRDLLEFEPNGTAMHTTFKDEMSKESARPLDKQLMIWYNEGKEPFGFSRDIIGFSELQEYLLKHGSPKVKNWVSNTKSLSHALETLGAVKLGQVLHKPTDMKPTLYVIRKHQEYKNITPSVICNKHWKRLHIPESPAELVAEHATKKFQNDTSNHKQFEKLIRDLPTKEGYP